MELNPSVTTGGSSGAPIDQDSRGTADNTASPNGITSNTPKDTTNEAAADLQRNKKAPTVVVNFADAIKMQTASMAKKAEEKNASLVVNFADAVKASMDISKQAQGISKTSGLVINCKTAARNNAMANFRQIDIPTNGSSKDVKDTQSKTPTVTDGDKKENASIKVQKELDTEEGKTDGLKPWQEKAQPDDKTEEVVATLVVGFDQAIESSKTGVAKYGKDGKLQSIEIKKIGDTKASLGKEPSETKMEPKPVEKKSPGLQRNRKAPTVVVNFADAVKKQTATMAKAAEEEKTKSSGLLIDFNQAFKENKAQMAKAAEDKKKREADRQKSQEKVDDGEKDNMSKPGFGNYGKEAPNGPHIPENKTESQVLTPKQKKIKSELDQIMQRTNNIIDGYEGGTNDIQKESKSSIGATEVPKDVSNCRNKAEDQLKPTVSEAPAAPVFVKDKDGHVDFERSNKTPSVVVNFAAAVQQKAIKLTEKAELKQTEDKKEEKIQKSFIGRVKKAVAGESNWKNVVTKRELKEMTGEKRIGLLEEYIHGERYAYNKPKPIKEINEERQKKEFEFEKSFETPSRSKSENMPVLSKKNDSMTTLLEGLPSERVIEPQSDESEAEIKGMNEMSPSEEKCSKADPLRNMSDADKKKMDGMSCDEIVGYLVDLNTKKGKTETAIQDEDMGTQAKFKSKPVKKQKSPAPPVPTQKKDIPLDDLLQNVGEDKSVKLSSHGSVPLKEISNNDKPIKDHQTKGSYQPTAQAERKETPLDSLLMDFVEDKEKSNNDKPIKQNRPKGIYQPTARPERKETPLDSLLMDLSEDKDFKLHRSIMRETSEGYTLGTALSPAPKHYPHLVDPVKVVRHAPVEPKTEGIPLDELLKDFGDEKPLNMCASGEMKSKKDDAVTAELKQPAVSRHSPKSFADNKGTAEIDNFDKSDTRQIIRTVSKRRGPKAEVDPCMDFCDYIDKLADSLEGPKMLDGKELPEDKYEMTNQQGKREQKKYQPKTEADLSKMGSQDICDYLENLANQLDSKGQNKAKNTRVAQLQGKQEAFSQNDIKEDQSVKRNGVQRMAVRKMKKIVNDDLLDPNTVPAMAKLQNKDTILSELCGRSDAACKDRIFDNTWKHQSQMREVSNDLQVYTNERINDTRRMMPDDLGLFGEQEQRNAKLSKDQSSFRSDGICDLERLAGERGQRRNLEPCAMVDNRGKAQADDNDDGLLGIEQMAKARGQTRNLKPGRENTEPGQTQPDIGLLDIERVARIRGRDRGLAVRPVQKKEPEGSKTNDGLLDIERMAGTRGRDRGLAVRPSHKQECDQSKPDDGLLDIERVAGARGRDRGLAVRPTHKQECDQNKPDDGLLDIERMAGARGRERGQFTQDKSQNDFAWLTSGVKKEKAPEKPSGTDKFGDMSWMTNDDRKQKKEEKPDNTKKNIIGDMDWLTKSNVEKKQKEEIDKKSETFGDMSWLSKSNDIPLKQEILEKKCDITKPAPQWLQKDEETEENEHKTKPTNKDTPSWLKTPEQVPVTEEAGEDTGKAASNRNVPLWLENTPDKRHEEIPPDQNEAGAPKQKPKPKGEPTKISTDINKDWDKAFAEMFDKNKKTEDETVQDNVLVEDHHIHEAVKSETKFVDKQIVHAVKLETKMDSHPEEDIKLDETTVLVENDALPETDNISETYDHDVNVTDEIIPSSECQVEFTSYENAEEQHVMSDHITSDPFVENQERNEEEYQAMEDQNNNIVVKIPSDENIMHSQFAHLDNDIQDEMEPAQVIFPSVEKVIKIDNVDEHKDQAIDIKETQDETSIITETRDYRMDKKSKKLSTKKVSFDTSGITVSEVADEQAGHDIGKKTSLRRTIKPEMKSTPIVGLDNLEQEKQEMTKNNKTLRQKSKKYLVRKPSKLDEVQVVQQPEASVATLHEETISENALKMKSKKYSPKQPESSNTVSLKHHSEITTAMKDETANRDDSATKPAPKMKKWRKVKTKGPVLADDGSGESMAQDANVENSNLRKMLMNIAITAHKLGKAQAKLKESEERYAQKYLAREQAKADQVEQKGFSDILDDQIVAVVTHSGSEPFPEKYRIRNDDNDHVNEMKAQMLKHQQGGEAQRKITKSTVDMENRVKARDKHKSNNVQPRVTPTDEHQQFHSIGAIETQQNDDKEIQKKRSCRRPRHKKAVSYQPDHHGRDDHMMHQTKTNDTGCDKHCHCDCHGQHGGDRSIREVDTNKPEGQSSAITMQNQARPSVVTSGPVQFTGKEFLFTDKEGENQHNWKFSGDLNVHGNFFSGCVIPGQEKKNSTLSKIKNVFKNLKSKK